MEIVKVDLWRNNNLFWNYGIFRLNNDSFKKKYRQSFTYKSLNNYDYIIVNME